jgi:hypothetical protein
VAVRHVQDGKECDLVLPIDAIHDHLVEAVHRRSAVYWLHLVDKEGRLLRIPPSVSPLGDAARWFTDGGG